EGDRRRQITSSPRLTHSRPAASTTPAGSWERTMLAVFYMTEADTPRSMCLPLTGWLPPIHTGSTTLARFSVLGDVLWAYQKVTKHSHNFIPTGSCDQLGQGLMLTA